MDDLLHKINLTSSTQPPAGICLLKVNNRNTKTMCKICSKLTIKMPERRQWRRSGIFIVNFEHFTPCFIVSVVKFEHVIASWVGEQGAAIIFKVKK